MQIVIRISILIMALAAAVAAQNSGTTVVPVSPTDVARIEQTYNDMKAAEAKWGTLQEEIGRKYLVVEKGDRNAGDEEWYPPEGGVLGTGFYSSGSSITSGTTLTLRPDGVVGWDRPECETAEHKADREAKEADAKARLEKERAEREAKAKRVHKGFRSPDEFVFSEGWGYLLPKPVPPYTPNPNVIPMPGWQFIPNNVTSNLQ